MSPSVPPAVSFERLAGCALGAMCGDALGMPVEGWSAGAIARRFGRLDELVDGHLPAGSYTDDSQMMIAILETLAARGRLDGPYLAGRFATGFEPRRGYGGRIAGVMQRLAGGAAWDQAGTDSWGNGGAMRVGVLGVYYADDLAACRQAALEQCRITHTHPRGLAGAVAQALAVAQAARLGAQGLLPDQAALVEQVAAGVEEIDAHTAQRLRAMPALPRGDETAARHLISEAYACDVTAPESVPPALAAFLAGASAEQAIVLAVSLGGDTDTMGAMAGAMAGAYFGAAALPPHWLGHLENAGKGRDYVLQLCQNGIKAKTG